LCDQTKAIRPELKTGRAEIRKAPEETDKKIFEPDGKVTKIFAFDILEDKQYNRRRSNISQ